jgi:AraC family transcriptional regulator of arabinose operon
MPSRATAVPGWANLPPTPHRDTTTVLTGHFRKGRGYFAWRPQGTRDWLLILTLDGRGRVGFRGGETIVQKGDVILLSPGTLHDYGVEPTLHRWELLWAHFQPRPAWHEWLRWPAVDPRAAGLLKLTPARRAWKLIVGRMRDAHALASSSGASVRRRDERAMNALEDVLLRLDDENPLAGVARLDPRVRAAMDHVDAHFAEPGLGIRALAAVATLSESRFAHLFRQQLGTTPQQYVEHRRVARARDLLARTGLSVKEIAAEVGFASPFYFSLRFKRATGQSPRAFRRKSG